MQPQVSFNGAQWFCLVVEAGCHRQIENALAARGFRCFFPKVRRWVSHARVKKAVERPLLGRYVFVEVDYPRQSFAPVMTIPGVESIISSGAGVPWAMPRREVDDLFDRYLSGEFDEIKHGVPIGARVAIVAGKFEDWIATVTGRSGKGRLTLKLLGKNVHVNDVSAKSVRPAFGYDLARGNPEEVEA